jgi:hypothetical protein
VRNRQLMPGNVDLDGRDNEEDSRRDELTHLAKICHSAVGPAAPSPYPALRHGIGVYVYAVLVCRRDRRLRYRGLQWCVQLLRCQMLIQCSVA